MSEIPPIQSTNGSIRPNSVVQNRAAGRSPAVSEAPGTDEVNISPAGQLLSELDLPSQLHLERLAMIRQAIADGSYLTPHKIEVTAELLLRALRDPATV